MKSVKYFLFALLLLISSSWVKASDFFWVNGSGNWSNFANHWQNGSGVFYNRLPSDTDNVFFNAVSFTGAGQTVTIDVPLAKCKNMNWTNAAFSPILAKLPANDTLAVYGSVIFTAAMTNNYTGNFVVVTNDVDSIRTNGIAFAGDLFFKQLGEYQLKSALTVNGTIHVDRGTLKTGNFNITAHNFNFYYFNFRDIKLGTSTLTITQGGINAWRVDKTNLTLEANAATFNFTYTGTDTIHFTSGGSLYNYNIVNFPEATVYIHETSTFTTLSIAAGASVLLASDETQGVTTLNITGTCAKPIFIRATGNEQATIEKMSGTVSGTYLYLNGIKADGGATFNATNTVDEGNNTGWTITAPAAPANLYWIGGNGNWYDATHWSVTSGGTSANCVPNLSTNVFFDANSFSAGGQTVTVNYNAYCNNMTWTGANAPNFSGSFNVTLNGSLTLSATMNLPLTGNYNFVGSGSKTINTFNRTLNGKIFLNNASGNFSFTSALTSNEGIELNNGSLATNNNAITAAYITCNNVDNTRSLSIGTSIITLTGDGDAWNLDATDLTFTSGNSTFNLNHTGVNKMTFKGEGFTYYDLNINTSTAEILGPNTFHWIKLSSGNKVAFESDVIQVYDSLIATGTCGKPVIISATEVLGNAATIRKTTGNTTVNFAYISNVIGAITSGQTYTGNNSILAYTTTGWTATAPVATGTKYYWINGTGTWNDTTHWSLSSGGLPTGCLPTINDTVIFDANSFNAPGQRVSVNVDAYCNLMDWTAATNNPNFNVLQTLTIRRNLLMNANMTTSGTRDGFVRFLPLGNNCSLNTQNVVLNSSIQLEGSVLADQLSLANNLVMNDSLNAILIIKGTFITNGRNITTGSFNMVTGEDKQITLGASVINLRYGWTALGITSGLTITPGTSHIIINGDKTGEFFHGAAKTYYDLTISSGGTAKSVVTSSNSFRRVTINKGVDLELEAGATQTTQRFRAIGFCTDSISIISSVAATQATITQNGDSIWAEAAFIKDIAVTGTATKGARFSTNGGNNTGWTFSAQAPTTANFTYPATLCRGTAINFTNTSTAANGNINSLTFKWEFGTGDTSNVKDPSYTYSQGGRKGVTLTTTYTNGCTSSKLDSITINDLQVQLESTASSGVICAGTPVTFRTLNNATTYQFFRNNIALAPASVDTFITVSNLQNNDSVYVVANQGGCAFPSNIKLKFVVNPAPQPVLVSSDANSIICNGEKVKFTGSGTGTTEYLFYLNGTEIGFFTDIDSFVTTALANGDVVRMEGKNGTTQCTAFAPQTFTFTVNPVPVVTLTSSDGDNIICTGESVTYTASGATQYQFTINGTPVGGFSATNTFTTTTLQQGNIVRAIGRTNGCDGTSNSFTMNVNPLPTVTLTNTATNNTLCAGDNVIFTAAGATAYEFFINGTSQSAPSVVATLSTASLTNGNTVSVVGQSLGCLAAPVANNMTVVAAPNTTLLSSDADNIICLNESVTFTAGGASTYEFFVANVSQGAPSASNTFGTTTILDNQTVEVVGYQNGCPGNGNNSFTYSVKQVPLVNIFSTDFDNVITRCEEVTFSALGASTYEFFINGASQGAASANNTLTSATLQNNQQIYVRGIANGCPNNSDTITMVVNQAPAVSISYNTPTTICQGTNVIFATSGADEYEFYLNGNLVQGPSGVTTYSNAGLNNADKIHVLGYTFGCANSSDTIPFTVNAFPVVTLTSSDADNTICLNESVTFTGSGATEYEFFINGNSQGPPSATNTFNTTSLLNNQNIRVRGTTNGCSTTSSAITFTVNPLPSISLFCSDLDNTICSGDNITFTALGGTLYEFFVDGVSQGTPSSTNTFSTTLLSAGTPRVWVVGTQNSCSRAALDTFTINVISLPNVGLLSSDNDNIICNGDTVTFTASGAAQYRFFVNNVAQGNFSANNTFVTSSLTNNQTVRVSGSNNGCVSQGTPTYTFTVNAVPNVALASSDIDRVICVGDAVTFTASGADLYEFFIDGVSQGPVSNITQLTTSALADSNRVRVIGSRNGCANASGTLLFRVNPLPTVALISSDTDNTICAGENITFTGSGANLYQFFVNGIPLSNPSATAVRSLTTLTNGQTVSLKGINQFGCEALAPQTYTITVNALPNVSLVSSDADNQICSREPVTFTANGATQYQFFVGSNAVTTLSNNNTYITDSITNAQTIRVLGITNGCSAFSNSTYTFNVSVFPTVGLTSNVTGNIICENDAVTFTASGSNLYEFFINNISQGTPAASNTFTTTTIQNGQTVSVQGINNNCRSNGNNIFTYTVRPLPIVSVISSDADNRICYGSPVTFTSSGASEYEYYINGLSQGVSTNNTYINDELENGDVITVKGYTNGCGNLSVTTFPFVVDKLNLTLTASSTIGMVCENEPIQFTANGANLYEFFVDGVSQGTSSANNTITLNNLSDGQMVTVEGFSNTTNCTQLADASFTVTVLTPPVMTPALDTAICEGDTITLTSNYEKGNQWYKNGNRIIGAENATLKVFESGVYSLETFRGGNGNVWTIGKNTFGQLGDTTNVSSTETILLPVFENITSLEAGINFNIANDASGKVYAWGHNNFGQLGDGTFSDENYPKRIPTINNAKEVAAGDEFSLVLTTGGNIFSFGKNDNGQLGQGNTGTQPFPFQINNFSNVAHITAGGQHAVALRNDGSVFAWGDNEYGQLGINSFTDKYSPNYVVGLSDIIQIAAGKNHSLAVKNDGTVWAWGNNANGQLGVSNINFSTTAIQIPGINNAVKAVGGNEHTLVLTADGRVFAFGGNTYGQLGNNSNAGTTTPVKISGLFNVKNIYAGAFTSYAIKNDGSVWAWGLNIDYQLATGNNANQLQPAYAKELSGAAIIGAGNSHAAIVANNKVSCQPNAITVTVNAIPNAEIFSTGTGLSTNAGGTSYQWYYNGLAIPSGTQQNLPTTTNGNYQVAITNQFGCTTFSDIYSFNVGIATIVGNNPYLKFYPNPTSGWLYVSFNDLVKQEISKVTVVNILGETVVDMKKEVLFLNESINLSSQASGVYFIHTVVGETIFIDKIILNNY